MSRKKNDLRRTLAFVAIAALLMLVDQSNAVVVQALIIGMFMAVGSHITRRVLFPDLDLQLIAKKAMEAPLPAAIVFSAICMVLVAVMFVGMMVLK